MILKNAKIVLEDKTVNGWIEISGNQIKSINSGSTDREGLDLNSNWLLPGFIDCHVHGGYGVDFETGTIEGYKLFAKKIAQEGVTKYCQGSVTNSDSDNVKYFTEFKEFMNNENKGPQSRCLGCHLEGPFISPEKKGAHELGLLKKPDIKLMQKLIDLSGDNIKVVTYAPDEQNGDFTKFLLENKIIPSAGHSNISSKQFNENDYPSGIRHVTHIFNGMSGVSQHEPGLAASALLYDDILCEVISDGIHIQPETLKLIYKIKGPDNICIITDAMNAKGLADGKYKLGNLDVIKEGMKVYLSDSKALAGAGATYDHNVRTYLDIVPDISMNNLIKMTSINIAKQLEIFNTTGSIAEGKLADLVVLDKKMNVVLTISEGEIAFQK